MELAIGEVADLVELPVKTIRFYADEGLLLGVARTRAGHRIFDERHVARLELIKSLRDLGTDLATIRRLLDRELDLEEVLTAQARLVAEEQARLERRRAVLEAALASGSDEVAARLPVLDRLDAFERTALLERFWDEVLADAPDPEVAARFRAAGIPALPDEPDAAALLAWLELVELATDPSFVASIQRINDWGRRLLDTGRDPATAGAAIEAALDRAVAAGEDPDAFDAALDAYVTAHAELLGRTDSPAFRRWLGRELDQLTEPRAARFWQLIGELGGGLPMEPSARDRATAMERILARLTA